jgi:hypothetical protein
MLSQHECFFAYAPRGGGLLCALACDAQDNDVAGWFIGLKDYAYQAAYFKIESFFSVRDKQFFATLGSDLYGGWRFDYGRSTPELDEPLAVDQSLCHRLEQVEDAFAAEWLVFRDDPRFAAEEAAYAAGDLPAGDVVVHHARLAKFERDKPVWTYYSRGFNDEVLKYMAPRWALDYGRD